MAPIISATIVSSPSAGQQVLSRQWRRAAALSGSRASTLSRNVLTNPRKSPPSSDNPPEFTSATTLARLWPTLPPLLPPLSPFPTYSRTSEWGFWASFPRLCEYVTYYVEWKVDSYGLLATKASTALPASRRFSTTTPAGPSQIMRLSDTWYVC